MRTESNHSEVFQLLSLEGHTNSQTSNSLPDFGATRNSGWLAASLQKDLETTHATISWLSLEGEYLSKMICQCTARQFRQTCCVKLVREKRWIWGMFLLQWVHREQNMQFSCLVPAQLEVSITFLLPVVFVTIWLLGPRQSHQLWLKQSGHFTRGLKCIQLSFETLSTVYPFKASRFSNTTACEFHKGLSGVHSDNSLWCNWNSQQYRLWKLFCCNRDDGIGHLARGTLQSSAGWFSNLRPSKSQNVQFDQWDECSVSVRSGQIFWTFGGLPSHKVAPTKSQCRSAEFAEWNARLG